MISSNSSSYCRHGELHKIENYDKAVESLEFWECHHRLELTLDGEFAHTHNDLKRLRMYYNRPAYELIFLSRSEHKKLHWSGSKNDRRKNAARHVLIEWKEHGKSRANKNSYG